MIQYGAWDRLDDNKPFLAGYGEKPDVCNYYPLDITEADLMHLRMPIRTHGIPSSVAMMTVL